jgi:hypothetical protein
MPGSPCYRMRSARTTILPRNHPSEAPAAARPTQYTAIGSARGDPAPVESRAGRRGVRVPGPQGGAPEVPGRQGNAGHRASGAGCGDRREGNPARLPANVSRDRACSTWRCPWRVTIPRMTAVEACAHARPTPASPTAACEPRRKISGPPARPSRYRARGPRAQVSETERWPQSGSGGLRELRGNADPVDKFSENRKQRATSQKSSRRT